MITIAPKQRVKMMMVGTTIGKMTLGNQLEADFGYFILNVLCIFVDQLLNFMETYVKDNFN